MAVGWAREGAIQEQIEASLQDEIARTRRSLIGGETLTHCEFCEEPIPEKRREALPGVRRCVQCQAAAEAQPPRRSLYNRRGSKDSQLK